MNKKWKTFKLKMESRIYRKPYATEEIIEIMKSMGLKKGANIFIHSSFDKFFNYTGTISEFIDAILTEIGSEGTLAMPAFPLGRKKAESDLREI